MKRTIRTSVLILGLAVTLFSATLPTVAALDGGSIPLCPPSLTGKCAGK